MAQLGRTLDGRGRPSRDRAARLPHGHAQHRPGAPRARPDDAAPAGLRPWPRPTRSTAWPTSRSRSWRRGSRTATPGATRTTPSRIGSWSASRPTRTCTWSSTGTSSRPRSRSSRRPPSARSWTRSSPSRCRAPAIPNFLRKAADIAKAGIYDLRVHRDEVLLPILRYWGVFELERAGCGRRGGTPPARGRTSTTLDAAAKRFEERLVRSGVPRIAPAGQGPAV